MKNNKSISAIKRGMRRDSHVSQQKNTDYSFALNADTTNDLGEGFNIQNEPSNRLSVNFPTNYKVIHEKQDLLNNRTYYFLTNPLTNFSSIGYIDNSKTNIINEDEYTECADCLDNKNSLSVPLEAQTQTPSHQYVEIINDLCHEVGEGFNFDVNFPILFSEIKQENNQTTIYWNDYKNPPRWLNLTNTEYLYSEDVTCSAPNVLDCFVTDRLLQFPKYSQLKVTPEVVQTGGQLRLGTYEFWVAYCNATGVEMTDYSTPTNPVKIFDENNTVLEQTELDSVTNFAIKLKVENIDTSFQYYKVVVVQRTNVNDTQSYFLEGIHPTTDNTVLYSSDRGKQRMQSDVLTQVRDRIEKAKGVTESDNKLFQFGTKLKKTINLQPVVNLIGGFVKWQSSIAKEDLFKDPIATSKYQGYHRDEIQPLAIRFKGKDGTTTPAFPLVARPAFETDRETIDSEDKNRLSLEDYNNDCFGTERTERWQVYNTATKTDSCVDLTNFTEVEEVEEKICTVENVYTIEADIVTFELDDDFTTLQEYIEDNPDVTIPGITEYLEDEYEGQNCTPIFGTIFTSGELSVGQNYVIYNLEVGDDFDNVGFLTEGEIFVALATTPTVWTNGTEITKTDCETPELFSFENVIRLVENEVVTKNEKVFPDDYSTLRLPQQCSIYTIGDDGKPERDLEFEKEFMTYSPFPIDEYARAFFRDYGFSNDQCLNADDLVNVETTNTTLQPYFLNYYGAETQAELETSKEVTFTSGASSATFSDKLHVGALWFRADVKDKEKFIVELSKQLTVKKNDDIIRGGKNPDRKLRVSVFNRCSSTVSLYSQEMEMADGLQLLFYDLTDVDFKIDNGTTVTTVAFPLTGDDFYVSIDAPIVAESAVIDPENESGGNVTKYRTAPPDACFTIALRDVEYESVTVSWDNIFIDKIETYRATCTSTIPIISDCEPTPYEQGYTAYWESIEEYPNNDELYNSSTLIIETEDLELLSDEQVDFFEELYTSNVVNGEYTLNEEVTDLKCKPIRHYKLPDNNVSSFIMDLNLPSFSDSYIFPLGFNLDNNVVTTFLNIAVKNNLITQEDLDNIESYEILRADNTLNKTVLGSGLAYDMYKYVEKEKDVYYSNFPHNDLGEDIFHYEDETRNDFIQHPFNSEGNNKFTFISPDFILNRKLTPTEVTFSGYQIGNSRTFFPEVEDHAKWTILGRKARDLATTLAIAEVALETAVKGAELTAQQFFVGGTSTGGSLGSIGAGIAIGAYLAQGFVKVGQYRYQWLETFKNIGGLYNFASYGVSEGFHNKFLKNTDNQQTVRALSAIKNLKSDRRYNFRDEKTGENILINAYQREYSSFLSTGTHNFDYGNEYIYNDNNTITQSSSSRTISSRNNCDGKESIRNVGSPYFTLKNYVPNLFGDIDSIVWLTTNYIKPLNENTSCTQIFGGTAVISRFSYIRKIPFFSATAFDIADKLPFAYSLNENIPNVRFYCDYEIDTEFSGLVIPFPDIDSNYNFDCQTSRNRMYIKPPSKMYLYYYGIANFLVESDINCNFRYSGKAKNEQFYPQNSDIIDLTQQKNIKISEPNIFKYNNVYSEQVSKSAYFTLPRTFNEEQDSIKNDRFNRVIISEQDSQENDFLVDQWLINKPLNYYDFPTNKGRLKILKGLQSNQILAVFEDEIVTHNAIDTIQKGISDTVLQTVGSGGVFDQRPIEIKGVGSQVSEILETPYGYFIVDNKRGKIVQYSGATNVEIISDSIQGQPTEMKDWFRKNLPFKILRYLPTLEIDNKFKGIGISMGWDSQRERVFITKRDYALQAGVNPQNLEIIDGVIYYEEEQVELTNTEVFKDVSWTISYKPKEGSWASYFSFTPDYYSSLIDHFRIGYNKTGKLWEHLLDNSSFQVFQGELFPFIVEYPTENQNVNKVVNSLSFNVESRRYQNQWDFSVWKDVGFNKFSMWSNTKHTGVLNLFPQKTLADFRNYPKTNNDGTQDILFTPTEGKHKVNYFFNRVVNQDNNIPIFLKDENNILKTVNTNAVKFAGKRVLERMNGTENYTVQLTNDQESRFNIILKNSINNETIYED